MRFDHVAIACRDVEAQRAWYESILQFQVKARKSPSRPDAPETAYLSGPPGSQVLLELMPDDRQAPAGRKPFTSGISHIAFAVDSFAAWEQRLSEAGVRWLGEPVEALGGGKLRSFLDPEGNMLQIIERS
jgi:glyoxylase I family protein